MELTFIGLAQLVLGGLIVITGRLRHALLLLMVSCLLAGSAAINLPAIGGSSIPPSEFALLFVFLRLLMPGSGTLGQVPDALRANRWIALFALYGVASAIILPRLFAGAMEVAPMRALVTWDLFATVSLEPTSQNLTTGFYLVGMLLTVVASWILVRRPGMDRRFVTGLIWMTWIHAVTGIAAALLRGTPADAFFELFRNANYAQMDDAVGGFARIRGLLPEASTYAGLGFGLFVANAELWYRSVRSRATGTAAMLMGLVLFFSTSSTAYVGLAVYGLVFVARTLALPGIADFAKARIALAALGMALFLSAVVFIVMPDLINSLLDVVKRMTIEKSDSDSSLQRWFWAAQGWEAFRVSWGLGIGAGSFRSSSLLFAVLGSMGVAGILTLAAYLITLFQPGRRSSWSRSPDSLDNIGGALAMAALLGLVPSMVSSPSPIPSSLFSLLAGASLALRPFGIVRSARTRKNMELPDEELASEMFQELRESGLAR